MFDIVPALWHRISQARADRRLARSDRPARTSSPSRTSFGETIAIGLGCDSRGPNPPRAEVG